MQLTDLKHQSAPVISDTQCVHSILTTATCSRCVSACPHDAIVLNDEYLGLDDSLCSGCGLCVNACPMGAIELPRGTIAIADSGGTRTAFFACQRGGNASQKTRVSCIHTVGLADLSILHKMEVRQLVVEHPCTECKVNSTISLPSTLRQFNRVMESRGCTAITAEFLASGQWKTRATAALASVEQPDNYSRRRLFAKLVQATDDSDSHLLRLDSRHTTDLPGNIDSAIHAFVPDIDGSKCNGCNACSHICPTHALTLVNADPLNSRYKIVADACTGCGMCVDICESSAVSIHTMQRQDGDEISLLAINCRKCGVHFYRPRAFASTDSLCRICNDSGQKASLFQVLE